MRAKRAKIFGAFLGVLQGKTAKKRLFLKVPNRQKVDFWPARILEIWKPFFKHLGRILKIWKPFFKHLADFELKGGVLKLTPWYVFGRYIHGILLLGEKSAEMCGINRSHGVVLMFPWRVWPTRSHKKVMRVWNYSKKDAFLRDKVRPFLCLQIYYCFPCILAKVILARQIITRLIYA